MNPIYDNFQDSWKQFSLKRYLPPLKLCFILEAFKIFRRFSRKFASRTYSAVKSENGSQVVERKIHVIT
jgi:hypothetical protein